MAKDQGAIPTAVRARGPARPKQAQARPAAPPAEAPAKKRTTMVQFFREVRAEARKVTWTSWRETWITSVMVFIMVVATALFFFTVDATFGFVMNQILKLGNLGS